MSAKCTSVNCNRKPDPVNNQNLCVLCYDWFQKCQEQSQANLQYHQQNVANHKELIDIHNNLSNGIYVDQNSMMRALIGSMINLMNQTTQVASLKEELNILENRQKELEDDVSENKVKIYSLEYDFKQLDEKTSEALESFSTDDSLVIRNLPSPTDGDESEGIKKVLTAINVEEFDPEEHVLRVEREGNKGGNLGTVFVKVSDAAMKKKIMKKKKELKAHSDCQIKNVKIMNYKTQEQILFENALRNMLAIFPNGSSYELNGNIRLIAKK